ncbi:MAG: hypothetical protein RSA70_02240, partial [Clostridia bacterium]
MKLKRILSSFIMVFMLMGILPSGTIFVKAEDILVINDANDMVSFATRVNAGESTLSAKVADGVTNIDLSARADFKPIGNSTTKFSGNFDGNGATIKLNIDTPNDNNVGLFGVANGNVTIKNVTVDGSIKGWSYVGGILGYSNASNVLISNCTNKATILSGLYSGGILGYGASNTIIANCTNKGLISGVKVIAGIVGNASSMKIINCVNEGDVTGTEYNIGGIVGYGNGSTKMNSTIINCYNTATITGNGNSIGGVIGTAWNTVLKNCLNVGQVNQTGSYKAGGVAGGSGYSTIEKCYFASDGTLNKDLFDVAYNNDTENTSPNDKNSKVSKELIYTQEGLALLNTYVRDNASIVSGTPYYYWMIENNKIVFKDKEIAISNKITNNSKYLTVDKQAASEADIITITINKLPNYLQIDEIKIIDANNNPVTLSYIENEDKYTFIMPDSNVVISAVTSLSLPLTDGVFIINNADNMVIFASAVNDGYTSLNAKLINDIDLDTIKWQNIKEYKGTFDGQGYTIKNLNKNSGLANQKRDGFIKKLSNDGVVQNVTFDTADVFSESPSGIIVHENSGTISNCLVTSSTIQLGNINGLGGITGINSGTVKNCAVINTTFQRKYSGSGKNIGGITEINNKIVSNCFTYGCTFNSGSTNNGAIVATGTAPTNNYYYTGSAVSKTFGTEKTMEQFKSGEVAYLLGDGWGQNLLTDSYPVLGGQKVYASKCDHGFVDKVSNSFLEDVSSYDENEKCTICGNGKITVPNLNVDNFYEITNAYEYLWVAFDVANGNTSVKVKLMNDID